MPDDLQLVVFAMSHVATESDHDARGYLRRDTEHLVFAGIKVAQE